MSTMNVLDASGATVAVEKPLTPGRAAAAASRPVALSNEDLAALQVLGGTADAAWASGSGSLVALLKAIATNAISTAPSPVEVQNPSYKAVAASASAQVMGTAGAAGDILSHVVIIPATTSPGAVSIQDGAGSAITIFAGGASSVTTLIPFVVPLAIVATTNWKITTGASVSAIGVGKFS
jgi:hypothetical protein